VLSRLISAARSPLGRLVTGALGLTAVALIVRGIGFQAIAQSIAGAARLFPLVLALEGARLACTILALRALYACPVPGGPLVRAGLIGYAVMGLVPAGRAVAEVARAALLARYVGAGRAAVAAVRIQVASLLANAFISIPAAAAAWLSIVAGAPTWLALAIAGNFVLTLAVGLVVLSVSARAGLGSWAGRVFRAKAFGDQVESVLEREPLWPFAAIAWEILGRLLQVVQYAVLLACVGGVPTLRLSLVSVGIHLVGAAVGDLLPAQLGSTEGNFTLAASALALPVASAVAIALLAHLAQLVWVIAGSLVSLWPVPAPTGAVPDGNVRSVKAVEGDPVP